jgi:hypothetical protein
MLCLKPWGPHETTLVSQAFRRRGGGVAARSQSAKPNFSNWASGKSCGQATRAGKSSCREAFKTERKKGGVQQTRTDRKDCASRPKILHVLMRKEVACDAIGGGPNARLGAVHEFRSADRTVTRNNPRHR